MVCPLPCPGARCLACGSGAPSLHDIPAQRTLGTTVVVQITPLWSMAKMVDPVIEKLARALKVDIRDLFEVEHEETSPAALRKKVEALVRACDVRTLQQAVRLLCAILR